MTKRTLTMAGLVIASAALAYEVTTKVSPKMDMVKKTAHLGIAVGLALIAFASFKKD